MRNVVFVAASAHLDNGMNMIDIEIEQKKFEAWTGWEGGSYSEWRAWKARASQIVENDKLACQEFASDIVALIDSYAESCRLQGVAQGEGCNLDVLRGSLEAAQFLSSVIASMKAK